MAIRYTEGIHVINHQGNANQNHNETFAPLPCYVYYEKNEAMQEFMVEHVKSASVEEEKNLRQREASPSESVTLLT